MDWFRTYSSNTLGGTGNQVQFDAETPMTGRIYYKVFAGGSYHYSLLFTGTIDSTYKPEYHCVANLKCGQWEILRACVGICKDVTMDAPGEVSQWTPLTFQGQPGIRVQPGAVFTSDPVVLNPEKGDYLCYQVTYRGQRLPYHLESVLPTFVQRDGQWSPDKRVPVPNMIGCDRPVKARIGYLGDSITQGIGTPLNSYAHWCALVSEAVGADFSYWNLGIGYGRAQDAASDGAWLYKAKQCDAVVIAYGSNDIGRGRTLEQIKQDMTAIVDKLKAAGIRVFLISVPPFDWKGDYLQRWNGINDYIRDVLRRKADGFFDVAPLLTDKTADGVAIYGTHPNEEGCRIWADAMLPQLRQFLRSI